MASTMVFLTDFGSVPELEQAPIVCVSPMDFDQPTQLIARKFHEFLSVNQKDSALFYNHFKDERSYALQKQEWAREQEAFEKNIRLTCKRNKRIKRQGTLFMCSCLSPPSPIPSLNIEEIRAKRAQQISLPAKDRLGVIQRSLPLAEQNKERSWSGEADSLREYLQTASYGEKLTVFRDMTLGSDALLDPELRQLLIDERLAAGLTDEAERLRSLD